MSSCPPSASTPSTQALCQGAIKPANACLQLMPLPRSTAVLVAIRRANLRQLFPPLIRIRRCQAMTGMGVRRDKAALSSGCKPHPAIRSSRKQSEQSWR